MSFLHLFPSSFCCVFLFRRFFFNEAFGLPISSHFVLIEGGRGDAKGGHIRKSQQHTREFAYGGEIRKIICLLLFRHYFNCSLDTVKRDGSEKSLCFPKWMMQYFLTSRNAI